MRTIDDLENNALKHWPATIVQEERDISVIPKLIASQDKFISVLTVADSTPFVWKEIISATTGMPANLFLKHLMVLSDYGGEKVKKIKKEIESLLDGIDMNFVWKEQDFAYSFKSLRKSSSWTNNTLKVMAKE